MQKYILNLFDFIIPLFLTYFLLKVTIPFFKKIFPSIPNNRGMYSFIKPSSGGLIFVVTSLFIYVFKGYLLPFLSLPMALIGALDDKYNLSRTVRYIMQIVTLLVIIFTLKFDPELLINKISNQNFIFLFIFIFLGTIIINTLNFMDGIDGLVCGTMIVIFSTINMNLNNLLPIIGSLTGFLVLNWYPSKIFMGDSGSLYLGTYLASLVLNSENFIEVIKILFLCSPLLLDSSICIIRRFLNGQNIFKSHKLHLYQRLVSSGIKHSYVSLIYILSVLFLSLFYLYSNIIFFSLAVLLIIILGVYLDKKYAVKFV